MELILKNVVPNYIPHTGNSGVWNQEVVVKKGEHLHIIAPSGKGKTSLIHFIYGMRNDYAGSVILNNQDIRTLTPEKKSFVRQQVLSIVFQDLRLFPSLTVSENIEVKRRLQPFHQKEDISVMAARLGMEHKLQQQTSQCSFGEQQRAAIIRSLMQPFDFLLLDEPFSHLDEANREKAMQIIYEECEKRNASMIFADLKKSDFIKNEKTILL